MTKCVDLIQAAEWRGAVVATITLLDVSTRAVYSYDSAAVHNASSLMNSHTVLKSMYDLAVTVEANSAWSQLQPLNFAAVSKACKLHLVKLLFRVQVPNSKAFPFGKGDASLQAMREAGQLWWPAGVFFKFLSEQSEDGLEKVFDALVEVTTAWDNVHDLLWKLHVSPYDQSALSCSDVLSTGSRLPVLTQCACADVMRRVLAPLIVKATAAFAATAAAGGTAAHETTAADVAQASASAALPAEPRQLLQRTLPSNRPLASVPLMVTCASSECARSMRKLLSARSLRFAAC